MFTINIILRKGMMNSLPELAPWRFDHQMLQIESSPLPSCQYQVEVAEKTVGWVEAEEVKGELWPVL